MYMKNTILSFIVACFFYNLTLFGDPVITFFVKPYPSYPHKEYCQRIIEGLKRPGAIAQQCAYGIVDKHLISGLFATYAGYLNVTDANGQITFPSKQTKDIVQILVTPNITPIFMAGNTVHHWTIDEGSPTAMYQLERKEDPATHIHFWDAQQIDAPSNGIVDTRTIVIITNPQDIYIPLGITPYTDQTHLILPDMYIKKEAQPLSHALYMLNIKHLFGSAHFDYKTSPTKYSRRIVL
jgi:hypothetical protein